MRKLILHFLVLFVIFSCDALAFQCPPGHSAEKAFGNAERAFVVYVTDTRLEEKLLTKMFKGRTDMDLKEESVKLVSAGYRVIEELKGAEKYTPRLVDLFGIGTGYVGLTPGIYYLVLLPKETAEASELMEGMRMVNICTVPMSHYRLNVPEFQADLDTVRKLSGRIK